MADSHYSDDENVEKAAERGVTRVSPALSPSHKIGLAGFSFSDSDDIIVGPAGQSSKQIKAGKQGGRIVSFDKGNCDVCSLQLACSVKRDKRGSTLRYDA